MTRSDHLDIEDDYPEYLTDEGGYAYDAWDTLPASVIQAHDRIVAMSADTLLEVDAASLSNLERWALARAARKLGDLETFVDTVGLILANPEDTHGLEIAEIQDAAIRALAEQSIFDEARLVLEKMRGSADGTPGLDILEAYLDVREGGDPDDAFLKVAERWKEDVDVHYEICEELINLGRPAGAWIERAKALATEKDDRPTLLDLELLEARSTVIEG